MSEVDEAVPETVDEDPVDESGETDPVGADELGDPGKKALDAMKAQRNEARSGLREWKKLAAELGVDDAAGLRSLIESAGKPAEEPEAPEPVDVDKVRREAALEATKKANDRILRSEVKAVATGKLADPHDALLYLDLDKFDVDGDGRVDEDEITDAITDLLKAKPYLAAATAKRFQGSADGGARKGPPKPAQLTREDLKGMSPDAIVAAKAAGQLDNLLGNS